MAIAGELRAGTTVVMEELVRRLSGGSAGVSFFTLAPWTPVSIADSLKQDGFSEGTAGTVQTFYFRSEEGPWTSERLAGLAGVDVVIRLSAALAGHGIYPTVDPLTSRSRLLEDPSNSAPPSRSIPRPGPASKSTYTSSDQIPARRFGFMALMKAAAYRSM